MKAPENSTPEGRNRPLHHWTYEDPGLPCDLCGSPMYEDRTMERCTHCVHMMATLLSPAKPTIAERYLALAAA